MQVSLKHEQYNDTNCAHSLTVSLVGDESILVMEYDDK